MPDAQFYIRDHTKSDIPEILRIIKTAFAEQKGLVSPPSSAESKTIEIVNHELKTANALVGEYEGKIVACVFYQPISDEIYIDRLAVLPEFRRRGFGKLLMEEIESRTAGLGIRKLSLSVRIELENQQNYYRKMGFEITSYESHEGYNKPTYVMMKKSIKKWSYIRASRFTKNSASNRVK